MSTDSVWFCIYLSGLCHAVLTHVIHTSLTSEKWILIVKFLKNFYGRSWVQNCILGRRWYHLSASSVYQVYSVLAMVAPRSVMQGLSQARITKPHSVTQLLVLLVHGQVTIIFVVSVCLSVCLCRVFLSRLRSDLDQTRTHVTCPSDACISLWIFLCLSCFILWTLLCDLLSLIVLFGVRTTRLY